MAKASQVVKAILQEIIVQESEQGITAPDAQDTIFAMNNYMTALDAQGVALGYTEVSDLGDTLTIPNGAIQGLISNVAISVAGQFGAQVSNTTIQMASMGLDAMRKLGVTVTEASMPCTLPIGSGNSYPDAGYSNFHFFPCSEDDILTEQDGSILLETDS
jgi:hypothetical protein